MPSRKKAKGKARKAAKEAKAKEEESRAVGEVGACQRRVEEERLMLSAASPTLCRHGYPPLSLDNYKICREFIDAFVTSFLSQDVAGDGFRTATTATIDKYAVVYSSKLDTVVSMLLARGTHRMLLANGTHSILEENKRIAQLYASLAAYFEDYMAVRLHKTKAFPNLSKMFELLNADDHTLVSYYRKRIPCDCLDEKYKEVKSVKKMGWCFNPNCRQTERQVERSKMFSCTRCSMANYCSVECQKADWKEHRGDCDTIVKQRASFESNQT